MKNETFNNLDRFIAAMMNLSKMPCFQSFVRWLSYMVIIDIRMSMYRICNITKLYPFHLKSVNSIYNI